MGITQTGLLERLQIRGEPVALPDLLGECTLVAWLKQAGDKVERFDPLAVVEQAQVETTITAPVGGRLWGLHLLPGAKISPKQPLCYVEVPHAKKVLPQPTVRAESLLVVDTKAILERESRVTDTSGHDKDAGQEVPVADQRPSILPTVEQLVRERAARREQAASGLSKKSQKTKRPRTKAKVYRVTPDQIQRVKQLVHAVNDYGFEAGGPPLSDSELIRAGIELLASLSLTAVVAIVDENREREQIGKYGAGWPRPGYQRKKRS